MLQIYVLPKYAISSKPQAAWRRRRPTTLSQPIRSLEIRDLPQASGCVAPTTSNDLQPTDTSSRNTRSPPSLRLRGADDVQRPSANRYVLQKYVISPKPQAAWRRRRPTALSQPIRSPEIRDLPKTSGCVAPTTSDDLLRFGRATHRDNSNPGLLLRLKRNEPNDGYISCRTPI